MSQLKTSKTILAIFFATSFSMQTIAEDVTSDIPVIPMNTERMPAASNPIDMTDSVKANEVDQAILDAVSKSMPAKSIEALKKDTASGKVDVYGRPLLDNGTGTNDQALTQPLPNNPLPPAEKISNAPTKHLSNPVPQLAKPQVSGSDPIRDKVRKKYKAHQSVKINPGHSELVPVATGLQNRIATKFRDVKVKTSSMEVPIDVDGGFIYITPLNQNPIGLMIGERGMPETMVNLTLMPLDVPPVMIDVDVRMNSSLKRKYNTFISETKADEYKEKQLKELRKPPVSQQDSRVNNKYVERATTVLSEVAKGNIPNGFDFIDTIPEEDRFPCDIRRMAMYHEVGQRLVGSREVVDIVKVKNDINGFREIREEYCLADDVIAVGVYDRATLAPGESSELYIMRDKLYVEKQKKVRTRPRLTTQQ